MNVPQSNPRYVLDAFALVGFYLGEPRALALVKELLARSSRGEIEVHASTVNIAETLYQIQRRRGMRVFEEVLEGLEAMPFQDVAVDLELSIEAARLKAVTPISLADCYAAALATQLGAALVTGDADFRRFEPDLTIEWLGTPQ